MNRPNLNQRAYIALHLRCWYLGPRLDPDKPLVDEDIIKLEGVLAQFFPTPEMVVAYDIVLDWVDDPPRVT